MQIVDLTPELVLLAADDIRPEDRREWQAGCGQDVEDRLLEDTNWQFARAALDDDGRVLMFWGGDGGWVWLVATTHGQAQWRSLVRLQDGLLGELRGQFPGQDLKCWADDRNLLHHVWLRRLGFEPSESKHIGPYQLPFTLYTLKG